MHKLTLSFLISLFLVAGCATVKSGGPAVDGTNAQTTEASLAEMMQPMNNEQRLELFAALLSIQLDGVSSVAEARADSRLETLNFEVLSKRIGGMNQAEIMNTASESDTVAVFKEE